MRPPFEIRPLTTIDECRQVADLERTVWGYTDATDIVPPPVLIVSIKRGGILLGAFSADAGLGGFVYSIPALKHGTITQWSHMLGVVPAARDAGLGLRLKLAQREAALGQGVELIEWTYDPLQALNAWFNFAKLGVVVEEYEENIYGESSSPLHRGSPTDRFVAEWRLTAPHVQRRIAADGGALIRDARVASAPIVNPSTTAGEWLAPGAALLDSTERRVLIEIPATYAELQERDPGLALEWRMASRAVFQAYFARGYRVVDFFLNRAASRGHYLLAAPAEQ